jgi:hypothetical protein
MERNERKLHRFKLRSSSQDEITISYKSVTDREYMNDLIDTLHEGLLEQKPIADGLIQLE